MTREIEPLPEGRNLPRSGCYVFIALGLVLTSLTLWGFYTMFRQDQAIAKFTSDAPAPVPSAALLDQQAADELSARFRAFAEGRSDTFELTVEEINRAITTFGPLEEYRGLLYFKSIDAARSMTVADVSLTLNQPRFWRGHRYLNGWIEFKPTATEAGLQLLAYDVVVPDREVDPGFVSSFGNLDWLGGFRQDDHPTAKAFIERVRSVGFSPDKVSLRATATDSD